MIGPEHIGNKDAVVFNLTDGRVALMHRIHPNIQLAVFESLDAMWHDDAAYWNDHLEHLDRHTILSPSPGALSVGAGAPPIPTADGLLLFFHERRGDGSYTVNVALLDAATGHAIAKLPIRCSSPSSRGSAPATSTTWSSCKEPIGARTA